MSHKAQMKGVKKVRGGKRGGISRKRGERRPEDPRDSDGSPHRQGPLAKTLDDNS